MRMVADMAVVVRAEHLWKRYNIRLAESVWGALRRFRPNGKESADDTMLGSDRDFWALKDVSFEAEQGETLGIIGANGAGKSTLLKVLCGVTQQTKGNLTIKGRVAPLIEVGAGFHPELTGRENIYLNAAIMGMSKREIQRKFDEIVAFSELEEFIDTPVKKYSSGMYVRLGFAVAAHVEPDVLLVDEVLSVGDFRFQRKCIDFMQSLRQKGVTVIFISHQLQAVDGLCNRAIYLDRGHIVAAGDTGAVIRKYLSSSGPPTVAGKPPIELSSYQSGEVKLTDVEFIGDDGHPKTHFAGSENMLARVHFVAHQRIEAPVISVGIRRSDGLLCCSVRSQYDGFHINSLEGEGRFDVEFSPLQLTSGSYSFGVAVFDKTVTLPHGYVPRLGEFTVEGTWLEGGNTAPVYYPRVRWHTPVFRQGGSSSE